MKQPDFLYLLLGASFAAFKFAENYVQDKLIPEFRYNIYLNISSDNPELKQFDIYPEDDNKILQALTDKEVVEVLCRNEKVPVWIDISVEDVNSKFTVLKLLCAGRYSDNYNEFYYKNGGSGPFGIKSPNLPFDYKEGEKFKFRNRNTLNFAKIKFLIESYFRKK